MTIAFQCRVTNILKFKHITSFYFCAQISFIPDKNKAYICSILELNSMSTDPEVEERILQCIDAALGTLGKSGRKALLLHLKSACINRKEISTNPELFSKELNLILGRQGAVLLNKLIVKKLQTGFELRQKSNLTLAEAIKMIKATQEKPRRVAGSDP